MVYVDAPVMALRRAWLPRGGELVEERLARKAARSSADGAGLETSVAGAEAPTPYAKGQ